MTLSSSNLKRDFLPPWGREPLPARAPPFLTPGGADDRIQSNSKGRFKAAAQKGCANMQGPDPNAIHPNENIPSLCYIKNTITRPNIIVGDYTYYDDPNGAKNFEKHVTHHYDFNGDKLIICADSVVAAEKITENLGTLCSGDLTKLKKIK